MTPRQQRLDERFENLRKAVSLSHGPDMAFAAGAAAWLMVIEHEIKVRFNKISRADYDVDLDRFKEETREELQGFHQEICKHLKLDHATVLEVSHHFDQLIFDILKDQG